MKRFLIALMLLVGPISHGTPIDDVIARLDRHGLWMNGAYQPVNQPPETPAEVLAGHFLAATKRASAKVDIIEQRDLSDSRIGASGVQAIFVRSEPMSVGLSVQPSAPKYYVILFRFHNPETGWWSRIYPIRNEK